MKLKFHVFLTSALDESGQLHALVAVLQGKTGYPLDMRLVRS
jgi:hypothetical protein